MSAKTAGFRLKVDGKWLHVGESTVFKHPGGPVITQYSNADATHIFHAFHAGSAKAYKQLNLMKAKAWDESEDLEELQRLKKDVADVNISAYDISIEEEQRIVLSFERLRQTVEARGWLKGGAPSYYARKCAEAAALFALVLWLQVNEWYLTSACVLGLLWQQCGWLAHEFCHQQPFENREVNDAFSLFFGNVAQGFSRDWWKDKHNTHHAATNMVDHDGDIDLMPLFSLIPADLLKYKAAFERVLLKLVPYQHVYYTLMLPVLRFSWTSQSLLFAFAEHTSEYRVYRRNALGEQIALLAHWLLVGAQLWALPSAGLRVIYFLISQLLGGFLIAHVVTFNHNSVDKYPANSRLLNNFACLQILTTRNMKPSPFIDWFWGGLNYQIEHHLFPTMPRCHVRECSVLVKAFCAENNLPYMCDDYATGYKLNLQQLENIAKLAEEQSRREE